MVAQENFRRFESGLDLSFELDRSAGQAPQEMDLEHDARGLIIAVLFSMLCWVALGYFLLA